MGANIAIKSFSAKKSGCQSRQKGDERLEEIRGGALYQISNTMPKLSGLEAVSLQ